MTITYMRYYMEIYKCGNISKAASNLFISQPALSKCLKQIEAECETSLFDRKGNMIVPTDEGEFLYKEVQSIIRRYDALEKRIHEHRLSRNNIKIAYSVLSGLEPYLSILKEFRQSHPDIDISASINNTSTNYNLLDIGNVDLIITTKPHKIPQEAWDNNLDYDYWPLINSEMVFCVSKNHPLANAEYVDLKQIGESRLILMGGNFSVGDLMVKNLKNAGVYDPDKISFTEQIHVAIQMIKNNIACGFFNKSLLEMEPDIVGIPYESSPSLQTYLIWRRDIPLFWSAKAFVDVAKKLYPKKTT